MRGVRTTAAVLWFAGKDARLTCTALHVAALHTLGVATNKPYTLTNMLQGMISVIVFRVVVLFIVLFFQPRTPQAPELKNTKRPLRAYSLAPPSISL